MLSMVMVINYCYSACKFVNCTVIDKVMQVFLTIKILDPPLVIFIEVCGWVVADVIRIHYSIRVSCVPQTQRMAELMCGNL